MKYTIHLLITLIFISCAKDNSGNNNKEKVIIINEFLASNDTCCSDSFGDFDDWVELYNDSEEAVDIGGMFFTDTPGDDNPYRIPNNDPSRKFLVLPRFMYFYTKSMKISSIMTKL